MFKKILYVVAFSFIVPHMCCAMNVPVILPIVKQNSSIHKAAWEGNFLKIVQAFHSGEDIDALNKHHETPLQWAFANNQFDCAMLLMNLGADLFRKDLRNELPIHYAMKEATPHNIIFYMVRLGAQLDEVNTNGISCRQFVREHWPNGVVHELETTPNILQQHVSPSFLLHRASKEGWLDMVKAFLRLKLSNINEQDDYGATPLHYACLYGHTKIVQLLCMCGAKIDVTQNGNQTALSFSLAKKHLNIAHYLIRLGASMEKRGTFVMSPSSLAFKNFLDQEVFQLQLEEELVRKVINNGSPLLSLAVQNGWEETVDCLIKRGYNGDAQDSRGNTPLHYAVDLGDYKIMQILLSHGVNIDVQDVVGHTPLHRAFIKHDLKAAEFLILCGASLTLKDKSNALADDYFDQTSNLLIARRMLNYMVLIRKCEAMKLPRLTIAALFPVQHVISTLKSRGVELDAGALSLRQAAIVLKNSLKSECSAPGTPIIKRPSSPDNRNVKIKATCSEL